MFSNRSGHAPDALNCYLVRPMTSRIPLLTLLLTTAVGAQSDDWPQWRGPSRDGLVTTGPTLKDSWPESGPPRLWVSEEEIPSNDDGGHGSPVIADERAYLSIVWHRDVPTQTRQINQFALRKLGHQGLRLPDSLIEKAEAARLSLNPRLRGKELEAWSDRWIDKHLDKGQKIQSGDYLRSRFRKGKLAINFADLKRISAAQKTIFENHEALLVWLDTQNFTDAIREKIILAVPATKKAASDVVICIDMATGKTVWKTMMPGEATGRRSSSTPCAHEGRIYAVGSNRLFCLDAGTGSVRWEAPVSGKGTASSPVIEDGHVVVLAGHLMAFEAETGKLVWEHTKLKGQTSSPVIWRHADGALVLCNTNKELIGADLATGEVAWTIAGGGDSTPVISGNFAAVYSKNKSVGLTAFALMPDRATQLWTRPFLTRRYCSSPLIYRNHLYLLGGGRHLCLDLKSGEEKWATIQNCDISSPVIADGKIFLINRSFLSMFRASPQDHVELARARLNAMRCPSPAIAAGKIVLRMADRLACFDLR